MDIVSWLAWPPIEYYARLENSHRLDGYTLCSSTIAFLWIVIVYAELPSCSCLPRYHGIQSPSPLQTLLMAPQQTYYPLTHRSDYYYAFRCRGSMLPIRPAPIYYSILLLGPCSHPLLLCIFDFRLEFPRFAPPEIMSSS
jgi:hypothetical protein